MLPNTWLEYQDFADVHVEITLNFCNAYCMKKSFFVEKYFESWDPKIHGPPNCIYSFYLAALIE